MSGSRTDQMQYGCRALGCELGFLTAARRDAHEISAHGLRDQTLAAAEPSAEPQVVAPGVSVFPPGGSIVDRLLGPDDPDEEPFECPEPGCTKTFVHGHARPPEPPWTPPAQKPATAPMPTIAREGVPKVTVTCGELGCGRTFDSPQGLNMHRIRAHEKRGNNGNRDRRPPADPPASRRPAAPAPAVVEVPRALAEELLATLGDFDTGGGDVHDVAEMNLVRLYIALRGCLEP